MSARWARSTHGTRTRWHRVGPLPGNPHALQPLCYRSGALHRTRAELADAPGPGQGVCQTCAAMAGVGRCRVCRALLGPGLPAPPAYCSVRCAERLTRQNWRKAQEAAR